MNPAFKKYGLALLRKLSPLGFKSITLGDTSSGSLVANDFWSIAQRLQANFTSEDERFEKMVEVVSWYDAFKQKYANAQGEDLAQFNRFATQEFDAHMLALKMLVSVPSHNGILDVALLEQHFANISGIAPSRFKMEFKLQRESTRHINFILRPPTDSEKAEFPGIHEIEKNKFIQFHDALLKLGVIKTSSMGKSDSGLTISQVDHSHVLALAQFEIPDKPVVRSPSRRKPAVEEPPTLDKNLKKVAVFLKEFFTTEHSFSKQIQAVSSLLETKGQEGCDKLFKETEGLFGAAKETLKQKIYKLYGKTLDALLEENFYIVRANLPAEPSELALSTAEKFVLKKLEQHYLLKNAIVYYQTIAKMPCPWLDIERIILILTADPLKMDQAELEKQREHLRALCNSVKANGKIIAAYVVAMRWITIHCNELRKILNDKAIVGFDTHQKISLGINGYKGEPIERTEQEIIDNYLIVPYQRLPRYDMLLQEVIGSFNLFALEHLSENNFKILQDLIVIKKKFLVTNKRTNQKCIIHESDQDKDKQERENEQNQSQIQASVNQIFSALSTAVTAFYSSVEVPSDRQGEDAGKAPLDVQGGNAGSMAELFKSSLAVFGGDNGPPVELTVSSLEQSFRLQSSLDQSSLEQSSWNQSSLEKSERIQQDLSRSAFNQPQQPFARSFGPEDKAEIENLLQKQEEIKVEVTHEEEAYKQLADALRTSEKVFEFKAEEAIGDPAQHEKENLNDQRSAIDPQDLGASGGSVQNPLSVAGVGNSDDDSDEELSKKPVKVVEQSAQPAASAVEMDEKFSLYIYRPLARFLDEAVQAFGPPFHESQAKIGIKEVKSKVALAGGGTYFACNPELSSTTKSMPGLETGKVVWYIDANKKDPDPATVIKWIQDTWSDLEKHRGYFIIVGHGDLEAFKTKFKDTPLVVEAVIPSVQPQPPKEPEKLKKEENFNPVFLQPAPEKPAVEVVDPAPQPESVKLNSKQESQKHQDAQNPEPGKISDPHQEHKDKDRIKKDMKEVNEISKNLASLLDDQPRNPQSSDGPTNATRYQNPVKPKQPPSNFPPGVQILDETLLSKGKGGPLLVVNQEDSDVQIVISVVKKSSTSAKTFFKGFFNPSVWGIVFLLSMAVGMSAQALVGFSEPVFNIIMSIGVTALPVFAGLWLISALVYLGRLIAHGDSANGNSVSVNRSIATVFGILLGISFIFTISVILGVSGIPSELSIMKPLFDVIGHFLSAGLKVMGLDTVSNAFAVGGDLSVAVTTALIIAAPVLFTLLFVERFVTAHFLDDEHGEALDGLQRPEVHQPFTPPETQLQDSNLKPSYVLKSGSNTSEPGKPSVQVGEPVPEAIYRS